MIDEAELNHCKTITTGSHVCKKIHALMSSCYLEICAVKQIQRRRNIPKTYETRQIQLNRTVQIQLMDNDQIYFAPYSVTVTTWRDEKESVVAVLQAVGTLGINSECKVFTTSILLQASYMVMCNVTFNLQAPCVLYIRTGVSLLFRERFLYI